MKPYVFRSWLILLFLSLAGLPVFGVQPKNIRIDFVHPERFTDFRIQNLSEFESARIFSDEVSRYLSPIVARCFPNSTLSLRFTDIDLTGRLEPWHGPGFSNIRFIRDDTGPLRLYFDYQLTDSQGKLIASGMKRLVDVDVQRRFMIFSNTSFGSDRLFYEKLELRSWVDSLAREQLCLGSKLTRRAK